MQGRGRVWGKLCTSAGGCETRRRRGGLHPSAAARCGATARGLSRVCAPCVRVADPSFSCRRAGAGISKALADAPVPVMAPRSHTVPFSLVFQRR